MAEAEFDGVAGSYEAQHRANVAITGEEPAFFADYKVRLFAERPGVRDAGRIADFGAGIGNSVPFFRAYLPDAALVCLDVSARSLEAARERASGPVSFGLIEGDTIPLDDAAVDAAFSACVFHHIDHAAHVGWLTELRRIVRPGGTLSVYEHNPLNPLTVRAVRTCPFDANARLVRSGVLAARFRAAGWDVAAVTFHVFFPRALAPLRRFEPRLARLPLGAQYAVHAVRR